MHGKLAKRVEVRTGRNSEMVTASIIAIFTKEIIFSVHLDIFLVSLIIYPFKQLFGFMHCNNVRLSFLENKTKCTILGHRDVEIINSRFQCGGGCLYMP